MIYHETMQLVHITGYIFGCIPTLNGYNVDRYLQRVGGRGDQLDLNSQGWYSGNVSSGPQADDV